MSANQQAMNSHQPDELRGRNLLLYDGLCPLCNGVVRFIAKHDHRGRIHFAAQQSKLARTLLAGHGCSADALQGVALVHSLGTAQEGLFTNSDAVARALMLLGPGWRMAGFALRIIPRSLREPAYYLVACWRYKLFGRYTYCPLPKYPERFIGFDDFS